MKKTKTTIDLANGIIEMVKADGALPECIDYIIPSATSRPAEIYDTEFDFVGEMAFGGSEGIYVTILICGDYGRESGNDKTALITAKTLGTGKVDLEAMGKLMADIIWVGREYVWANKDDYVRRGYMCRELGRSYGIHTLSLEKAMWYKSKGFLVYDLYAQEELGQSEKLRELEKQFL